VAYAHPLRLARTLHFIRAMRTLFRQLSFSLSVGLTLCACEQSKELSTTESELAVTYSSSKPEVPSIVRNVAPVQNAQFVKPHMPPFRTSADGRIGLNMVTHNQVLRFYLNAPEKVGQAFLDSTAGSDILANTLPYTNTTYCRGGNGYPYGCAEQNFYTVSLPNEGVPHATLCESTSDDPNSTQQTNPYACGQNLAQECYDLTVIAPVSFGTTHSQYPNKTQFWGTPITIVINNPKQTYASIADIQIGSPVAGPIIDGKNVFEPMVTKDGRLIVARLGQTSFNWPDEQGAVRQGSYDVVYAVAPESSSPCDVTQWGQFYPISHAPYHAEMKNRNGLAKYPFLDPEGTIIPDGEDLRVTYPWMDRDGDNLFFTTVKSTLHYINPTGTATTRYPSKCLSPYQSICEFPQTSIDIQDQLESGGFTRGLGVAGLWTHGKMILLDNTINNTDFGLRNADYKHRLVQLYEADPLSADPDSGWIRIGSGRDTGSLGAPAGYALNTTVVDSPEHLFNFNENLKPQTVRDVVWLVNSGRTSEEVVFDDYVNPNAFLIAEMSASLSYHGTHFTGGMGYNDGFEYTTHYAGPGFDGNVPVRLQNSATATVGRWHIPSYGAVENGRIEPVALGGIEGKGFWMNPGTHATFDVPAQTQDISEQDWFVGVFVDPRNQDPSAIERLLTFPDGTWLGLRGDREVFFKAATNKTVAKFWIPQSIAISNRSWSHLGLLIKDGGAAVDLYANGMRIRSWEAASIQKARKKPFSSSGSIQPGARDSLPISSRLFQLTEGSLILGASEDGFVGWVDELKIFAETPNPELICNYARGTLIEVPASPGSQWYTIASAYPNKSHKQIRALLSTSNTKYACFVDYTKDHGVSLAKIPNGTISVRESLLFPEGPLVFGQSRPDSSANGFCLSCHTISQPGSLGIEALAEDLSKMLEDDPRRQPMQPNRRMYGHIPADLFSVGLPASPVITSQNGELVDQWIYIP
jgi:hypothetical protein